MNKIVKIHLNELLIDREKASQIVNVACKSHQHKMKVVGCCKINNILLVTLEELADAPAFEYVFAPFPSLVEEDIVSEIHTRYTAGFSTICGFRLGDEMWGLFALDRTARKPLR